MIKPLSVDDSTTSRPRPDPAPTPGARRHKIGAQDRAQVSTPGTRLRGRPAQSGAARTARGSAARCSPASTSDTGPARGPGRCLALGGVGDGAGLGGGHTIDTWQRLAVALDIRLAVDLGRDPIEEPADAGHLKVQELVLRLGRGAGYRGGFEVPTRPADPTRSSDVGLRDDLHRRLTLVECWNSIGDFGAAARSTNRKLAEAEAAAIATGAGRPYRVAGCWVVRATARNRAWVRRYPEIVAAMFPGSSLGWVLALTHGTDPPKALGLIWCDVAATRLFAWRR